MNVLLGATFHRSFSACAQRYRRHHHDNLGFITTSKSISAGWRDKSNYIAHRLGDLPYARIFYRRTFQFSCSSPAAGANWPYALPVLGGRRSISAVSSPRCLCDCGLLCKHRRAPSAVSVAALPSASIFVSNPDCFSRFHSDALGTSA